MVGCCENSDFGMHVLLAGFWKPVRERVDRGLETKQRIAVMQDGIKTRCD